MVIWLLPFPDGWFLCDRFYPLLLSMVISVSGLHDDLYPLVLQDGKPLCMDVLLGVLIPVMPGPALRQVHSLTFRSLTSVFLYPQHLHVWEEGNHRLTLRKYFPAFSILYFTMVRNCDQPTEAMALERCRFFIMFFTARSSQMKAV